MDTKDNASILRLQSEHLQELVRCLTAKLATLEQAVVVDDRLDALPALQLAEVGRLSRHITTEAERLQNYIEETTLTQAGAQPPRPLSWGQGDTLPTHAGSAEAPADRQSFPHTGR